ncbi:MAG: hypothetical protein MUP36_04305 [Demequinaceae bacterium]|nr:hypothetical protein [Demequinaceae bacterium]
MSLRIRAAIAVTTLSLTLTGCSSGRDTEADAAFCDATSGWGEALSILGSQMSALGSVSDGVEDPADPFTVAKMHQIGADLQSQAAAVQVLADQVIANTEDQDVIDAIEEINRYTIDIAIAMGEDAVVAEDLPAFTGLILEDYELYAGMADFDMNDAMAIISGYAEPICQTS